MRIGRSIVPAQHEFGREIRRVDIDPGEKGVAFADLHAAAVPDGGQVVVHAAGCAREVEVVLAG